MSTASSGKVGVVLMTYGSATTAEHVEEYFEHIYQGKVSATLIKDFENRYRAVGRSPLIEITKKQAALLEQQLGEGYVVRAGMRHSAPFISEAVAECRAEGAVNLVGIILSPQFSSFIMEGYKRSFTDAAQAQGFSEKHIAVAEPWPTEPHLIEFIATQISKSPVRPVIFTTHSLPRRVVEKDPSYLGQLEATINAVIEKLDKKLEWYAAYQSAGHTLEEWLKPDLVDVLTKLHRNKTQTALIMPIQFLADHLEILYDLDIAAHKQCEERGIAYHRTELPNTDPLFINALASIAKSAQLKKLD